MTLDDTSKIIFQLSNMLNASSVEGAADYLLKLLQKQLNPFLNYISECLRLPVIM